MIKINNRIKPSNRDNVLVVILGNIESNTNINNIITAKIPIGISRFILSRSILNGKINAVIPNINNTLQMFEPMIFPIDKSPSPCLVWMKITIQTIPAMRFRCRQLLIRL